MTHEQTNINNSSRVETAIKQDDLLRYYLLIFDDFVLELAEILKKKESLFNDHKSDDEFFYFIAKKSIRNVIKIASHYYCRLSKDSSIDLLDLIQEGTLGLLKAVDKFEEQRGATFTTYSNWIIRSAVTNAISTQSRLIRQPTSFEDELNSYRRIFSQYENAYAVAPSASYMRKQLGISKKKEALLSRYYKMNIIGISLGLLQILPSPIQEDVDFYQLPEFIIEEKETISELYTALSQLTTKQQFIIFMRFGLLNNKAQILEQIAEILGINPESVRRNIEKSLNKMRLLMLNNDVS